ncbi:hypothetical protein LDENG_00297510 [Lucifuga dentata]|nr:hypothetical protein LDENG_00297510 [Lucifuga dentata]
MGDTAKGEGRAKMLCDRRTGAGNQPDMVVVNKEQKREVVIDVAIPSNDNIRKKEHEKPEKYQELKEELD